MIKVGITGCDNLCAAELVRILINHPDVELKWVTASSSVGLRIDSIVPGIVGESDLVIEHEVPLDAVDVIFSCGNSLSSLMDLPMETHVIDMSGAHNLDHGADKPWIYGLSEMQRRILVHDARLVTLPSNVATVSLLALMPLARNLLLNSPVTMHVAMGRTGFPDGEMKATDQWTRELCSEVKLALGQCQSSFNQPVTLTVTPLAERRTLAVAARLQCGVDAEMIRQLYEQYYDDHNFVFMVNRPIVTADVENTNKCLICLDKDDQSGQLTIHAVTDTLLKGSAGNAVHTMNLMFGLHERVGLALKGSGC